MKKLIKVTVLTFVLICAFTPRAEAKFWGVEKATSMCTDGWYVEVVHNYVFWIETSVDITWHRC
jgi:hypothetical protein